MRVAVWLGLASLVWGMSLGAAAAPGDGWLTEAQRELAQREHFASANERGLQAPNGAHGFRTYFDANGVTVVARSVDSEPLAAVSLAEFGRQDDTRSPGPADVEFDGPRVTLTWPDLIARFENRSDGLAQEFTWIGLHRDQDP